MSRARIKVDPANVQLQLKVSLIHIRPPVWRRLMVPAAIKLPKFHAVLQVAFGWEDSHLHAFRTKDASYQAADPDAGPEELFARTPRRDEAKFGLSDLLHAAGDRVIYEYDFGDGWRHEIVLERLIPGAVARFAACTAGARACPPEDCGGPLGYGNLLRALGDPGHPEHRDLTDWMGDPFDPEAFNLEAVAGAVRTIKV